VRGSRCTTMPELPRLLALQEAAELLHGKVTVRALRKAEHEGRLHVIRLGGRDYTTETALLDMLALPTQPRPKCKTTQGNPTVPPQGQGEDSDGYLLHQGWIAGN